MKKIEQVFREILHQAMEKGNKILTQLEVSKGLGFSLSTINLAVKKLEKMNAVRIKKMNFSVVDAKKILYYWASVRDIEKDIVYTTRADMPVREIEQNLPDAIFGAYSAYKFKFKDVPADYSEVYVYAGAEDLKSIEKRFPHNEKKPNLFVMKADANMKRYGKTATIAQIFVDLWNMKEWYASDFLKALEENIKNGT